VAGGSTHYSLQLVRMRSKVYMTHMIMYSSKDYYKMSLADFVSLVVKEIVDILSQFNYSLMK
jgi:hypothetical protein